RRASSPPDRALAAVSGDCHAGQTRDLTLAKAFTFAQTAEAVARNVDGVVRARHLRRPPAQDANPSLTWEKRWPASWPTSCTTSRITPIVTSVTPSPANDRFRRCRRKSVDKVDNFTSPTRINPFRRPAPLITVLSIAPKGASRKIWP